MAGERASQQAKEEEEDPAMAERGRDHWNQKTKLQNQNGALTKLGMDRSIADLRSSDDAAKYSGVFGGCLPIERIRCFRKECHLANFAFDHCFLSVGNVNKSKLEEGAMGLSPNKGLM